jgi:hypothetical protein
MWRRPAARSCHVAATCCAAGLLWNAAVSSHMTGIWMFWSTAISGNIGGVRRSCMFQSCQNASHGTVIATVKSIQWLLSLSLGL